MKRLLPLFIFYLLSQAISAQSTVHKRWDARFGGTNDDDFSSVIKVSGGFILNGNSISDASGNKTQSCRGSNDCWIVKIDVNGNYLWDKTFGGTGIDVCYAITATTDGGCILGSASTSGMAGDKSQPSRGDFDYWVIKLDSLGNKQWDRRFGGSDYDALYSVKQTKDGGYILAGNSSSPISGDKTEADRDSTFPTDDYWIVKIDSAGNKQWDKRYGSSEEEGCSDVIQTPDGGYLIGGSSSALHISGDKTQLNFAGQNFWVVKVDSIGTKQWDRVFGGTSGETYSNALNTPDGNYLLAGSSSSRIGGNKTTANCGMWVIKVDTAGNKIGDWAYGTGASCTQGLGRISGTVDGGYLLTGWSLPDIGGDKTDSNLCRRQVWTIKIDSQMHRVWDKTCLTINNILEDPAGVVDCGNGCYLIGVQTNAGIGGDKTQLTWNGSYDYWVVEYCDTVLTGITETMGDVHFSIYPNPTSREVSIVLQKDGLQEASFTLTNTSGQLIYQSDETNLASTYTKILDLGTLPTGVYLLNVSVDGEKITRKVVKE